MRGKICKKMIGEEPKHMMSEFSYTVQEGCDHIFFVGFMGAGKTTLVRNLGELFKRKYLDTDYLVSRLAHKSVAELYKHEGVRGYRQCETQVLKRLKKEQSCLVSCGEGIVELPENFTLLKEMGKVVYLNISLDDSLAQIKARAHRPLLGDYQEVSELYRHREPLYRAVADYEVPVTCFAFEELAYTVADLLWNEGLL